MKKHTKPLALIMAAVMLMGAMVLPASASTADDGDNSVYGEVTALDVFLGMVGDIENADFANWTVYLVDQNGQRTGEIAVLDPDTFTWTRKDANGNIMGTWASNESPLDMKKPVQYFADVDSNAWYAEAVNAMAASGIINGDPDGSFRPEDNVTVGELCAIIYHIGKNDNPVNRPVPDHPEYTHWAAYAIDVLQHTALWYTHASPAMADETANRGEAVQAIMCLIVDAGLIDRGKYTQVLSYTMNDNDIPDWNVISDVKNQPYGHTWGPLRILDAYNYGIVHGVDSTGRFDPLGNLTRAELCQMLANAGLTQYTPARMADRESGMGFLG